MESGRETQMKPKTRQLAHNVPRAFAARALATVDLTGDLSAVPLDAAIPDWHDLEPDLFLDCTRFFKHLTTYDYFDAITYSLSSRAMDLRPRRLISCLPARSYHGKDIRHCPNVHSKLFLAYRSARLVDAFVGSQNFCEPTTLNLMTRVGAKSRGMLKLYFEHLWKNSYPHK